MLIVCPTCSTAYQIQLAALGGGGRSVRCAKCKNTWFATAESAVEEAELLPAAAESAPAPAAAKPSAPRAQSDEEIAAEWASAGADDGASPEQDTAAAEEPGTALMIAESPPLVPQDNPFAAPPQADTPIPEDVETIAARRNRQTYLERKNRRSVWQRVASLPMLIVALLAILCAALQWRVAMVRAFPQTASLYAAIGLPVNLRGLVFEDVKSTAELVDGGSVLVIEGNIVNPTYKTHEVPRLRFALRNKAGNEVYAWSALPPKTTLASGGVLPFRTRLASPPSDGRDVIVRFFNRRDVTAGIH